MLARQAQAGQGLAQMACVSAAAAGVKDAKPEWFNSAAYVVARREAKQKFRPAVAKTLLQLREDKQIPSWVEMVLDFDVVRMAAD